MEETIIALAKTAILVALNEPTDFNLTSARQNFPRLNQQGAVFVTLRTIPNHKLRGCIGSLIAHRPLYKDIILNAQASALKDSRFKPLKKEELKDITIEVSLLSKPKPLEYKNREDLIKKIEPLRDGVTLTLGQHRATYLPSVWQELKDFDDFFGSLCLKAGLKKSCLNQHPKLESYQTTKYKEKKEFTFQELRKASVNGTFYPKECNKIEEQFKVFNQQFNSYKIKKTIRSIQPKALLVPHAGYIYSGFTANFAYRFLDKTSPKRIIVIGPSHHYLFKGISGSFYNRFETPCANISIDKAYLTSLSQKFSIDFQEKAHLNEHSTEVQMPFIKQYFPNTPIIELIYSDISAKSLATIMVALLKNPDNIVIISSDLSHFYPLEKAKKVDNICLSAVSQLNIKILHRGCKACGFKGIEAIILASKALNLKSKLLDYKTSADAYGKKESVVGYLSAMFY